MRLAPAPPPAPAAIPPRRQQTAPVTGVGTRVDRPPSGTPPASYPPPERRPAARRCRRPAPATPPRRPGAARPAAAGAGRPDGRPRRRRAGRVVVGWRVTFDTGETFLVEGLALVGRRPEGRPGEPVRHLVPLPSEDMSVSKTHAQFQVAADGVLVVMDRGSTNGSMLVRSGVARELPAGQADHAAHRRRGPLRRPEHDRRPGDLSSLTDSFLDLLYGEAPRAAFDRVLADAESRGASGEERAALRRQYDVALRIRELLARRQAREAELRALYETASDLTAIRDVDDILTAIVRRARQLLNADMTYLSLNDETEGASYMKVTDGALTPEFRSLRLPLGTGLLGLVAQTGAPYFTEDYQADERFVHRGYIDEAVAGERIRAILGVPLVLDGRVIGALLAVHRSVRPFPPSEVTLLTSFAAHAAVALENARLFADLDAAHRTMTEHTAAVESAAVAHDRLTDVLVEGGGVEEVAGVLAEILGGDLAVHAPDGALLAGRPAGPGLGAGRRRVAGLGPQRPRRRRRTSPPPRPAPSTSPRWCCTPAGCSPQPERRTLERGALVTALVILFARTVAETEERLGGELLSDLLDARPEALPALRERARRRHVSLDGPLVLAVAAVHELDRFPASRVLARLATEQLGLAGDHLGRPGAAGPRRRPARGR